jgi:hypothetical protein
MKTVTFNPETHAVMPIKLTNRMIAASGILESEYSGLLAAAPEYPADAVNPCIDELISSVKALVACKGRFHTQQNFERLALAYKNFEAGNSPALPPAPESK